MHLFMMKPLSDSTFSFSDAINGPYVIDLYAGDYVMIQETFEDVLREYDEFVKKIISTYQEGDTVALKSAVHKIKPLFGFVGLTAHQSQCLDFENSCLAMNSAQLNEAFSSLERSLISAKAVIEKDQQRLAAFNAAQA